MPAAIQVHLDKVLSRLTMVGHLRDEDIRSLFFGDYMNVDGSERVYNEVTDLKELTAMMEQ